MPEMREHVISAHKIIVAVQTLIVTVLSLGSKGWGYPGGAPDLSCQSMLPTGHGAGPQRSAPPYSIFVSKQSYKPGETLQVVVQVEDQDQYFRGLFLQARMVACDFNDTKLVGVFTNTDPELETKHCFGNVHSAVTHNSARKKKMKTLYWTAPVEPSGHVVMRATVVRDTQTYWTDVESSTVVDLRATVAPKCYPPAPSLQPANAPPQQTRHPTPDSGSEDGAVKTATEKGGVTPVSSVRLHGLSETETTGIRAPDGPGLPDPAEDTTQGKYRTSDIKDDNLPSWLDPSFNQELPPLKEGDSRVAEGEDEPSWLIPAYQRSSSPSSSSSFFFFGDFRCAGSLVALLVVQMSIIFL